MFLLLETFDQKVSNIGNKWLLLETWKVAGRGRLIRCYRLKSKGVRANNKLSWCFKNRHRGRNKLLCRADRWADVVKQKYCGASKEGLLGRNKLSCRRRRNRAGRQRINYREVTSDKVSRQGIKSCETTKGDTARREVKIWCENKKVKVLAARNIAVARTFTPI